jgi:hypothetical protein
MNTITRRSIARLDRRHTAAVAALVLLLGLPSVGVGETVTVDPSYRIGERLHYSWHLENELSWSPPSHGSDWVKMGTDFEFVLEAKRLTGQGDCVFDLRGKRIESIGESEKGKLGVRADPAEVSYLFGKNWTKPGPKTPFKKKMTVTLGPRFQPTASTGLEPIALFLLPGVDPRVWFVVTTAPATPLTVGSTWTQDFDVVIPGAAGDPLHIVIGVTVVGIEEVDGSRAVTVEAKGELNLTDSDLRMKDGSMLHVLHGRYEVDALAKWDLERGFLRFARAAQRIKATADRPQTARLASEAVSRITLDRVE